MLAGLDAPEEPTLDEYIDRIEASAARLREEHGSPRPDRPATRASAEARRKPPLGRLRRRKRPAQPEKPWYQRRRTWFLAAFITPLLLVAGTAAYSLYVVFDAYSEINEPQVNFPRWEVNEAGTPVPVPSAQVEQTLPDWEDDEPVNIVLLGVDAETSDDQPPRSDTTIVIQIKPASNEVTMMSIPRDLMVFIPGFGQDKFNAAYPIGEARRGDDADEGEIAGGGPTLVAQTIGANFDIQIHYFVTIDFDGFRRVVDTVGGVVVDVETQLSDNLYPTDDLRLTRVYFPTGLQKMDGETALQYVRTRHADSDFGRAERQQQVLLAIREQAVSRELFLQARSLISDLQDTVRTDLKFDEMLALSNLGREIDPNAIARLSLWEDGLLVEHFPEFAGDAYYIEADWDAVLAETRAVFEHGEAVDTADEETTADEEPDLDVSVFVENGTAIPELAGSSAQLLADAGFSEVWPSDATRPQSESTIQVAPGQVETARYIADLLGFSDAAIKTVTGADGITVTLGEDVPLDLIPDPGGGDEPFAG